MVAGTNTEYAWDVFSIDLENKVLETFRVGAGEDRNIINQDIYDANKTEVRADEAGFQSKVYAIEDSLLA